MAPRIARRVVVVLSGCGRFDGSEVQEAVLVLLALDRAGVEVVCCAPDVPVASVVDHRTGDVLPSERRSVLAESARIHRGTVADLATLDVSTFSAAVFPGGTGVSRTLSDYAVRGRDATVDRGVSRFIQGMHAASRPLGLACMAPILAARTLGSLHPTLTIGTDPVVAADVEAWGARHTLAGVRDVVVDRGHRLATTPAFMVGARLGDVADGIDRLVRAVLEMA